MALSMSTPKTAGSSLNQNCVMSNADCVFDVNLDLLEVIGSHCDPVTKVQLCLASKDYYQFTRVNDEDYKTQLRSHFIDVVVGFTEKVDDNPLRLGKLRLVHKMYRFIIEHKYALYALESEALVEKFVERLDHFVIDGMSARKAKLYKKMLVCNN